MADGRRPGGLTALAVLNFVFAGLGLLGLLAVLALLTAADVASGGKLDGGEISKGVIYAALILGVVRMAILLTAGIGYIKMKRFLGRTLGNVYAILAIGDTVLGLTLLKSGFGLGAIIGLIYPVLTLVLVNTTFKDDLVN
ncbi:MAG: hypothetical protein H6Q90_466 [Deltaproteobacteria bacterium]|nr:hypothetical protein [Deltaproteobacteria bacterium]